MKERGIIPRRVKGFRDIDPDINRLRWKVIEAASRVYRSYGFEHWDTPCLEYAECLGKYLPDDDSADEGVYSFRNPEQEPVLDEVGRPLRDDQNQVLMEGHHLALRYDLTAPLARQYAEQLWADKIRGYYKSGAHPPLFRRYQFGPVYRFEAKLDPGRYREFWQLDFDTVGVLDPSCDAEVACVLCDALEAIGLSRSSFEVRVNNRKLHQGLFEKLGFGDDAGLARDILRVVDKHDKLGIEGVLAELTAGRKDPASGAFIDGLGLAAPLADAVAAYVDSCRDVQGRTAVLERLAPLVEGTVSGSQGLAELRAIDEVLGALGYDERTVVFDPTVARGLAYYSGPVFEVVSKLEYRDDKGRLRRFGSICGGGRYDGLVEQLLQLRVPATGAAIGVDRLVELLRRSQAVASQAPVLVTVMDKKRLPEYQRIAAELRSAGIAAEVYFGLKRKIKAQFAYADSRGCPAAVIAGGNEFAKGTVSVKDLRLGKELSASIKDREQWTRAQPAQVEVPRAALASTVQGMLDRAVGADE